MSMFRFMEETGFVQIVIDADKRLMLWMNRDLSNPLSDTIAPFVRESIFHIPLYVFLLLFVFINFGKKGWTWVSAAILLILFSDGISSHLIKPFFGRLRPCSDPEMMYKIRFLAKYCGANGSFTSSHATNHFAFAAFSYFTLRQSSRYFNLLFLWAGLISVAQVYVGVHYPLDIIVGALLGLILGWMMARFTSQTVSLH